MKVEVWADGQGWVYFSEATVRVWRDAEDCYEVTVLDQLARNVNAWDGRRLRVNGLESVSVVGINLHAPNLTLLVHVASL